MTDDTLTVPLGKNWEWQLAAACRGMDVEAFFHPAFERTKRRQERISRAKAICARCPVLLACRSYALETREPYGIWGGLSEAERADILGLQSLRYPAPKVAERSGSGPAERP